MATKIDPAKVEAEIAVMTERLTSLANTEGLEGVVMRMQLALIPPFIRWKFSEMNGVTTDNQICNAFVAFVSSQMAGLVADCVDDTNERYALANRLLQGIGEEVGSIFAGTSGVTTQTVPAEPVN